MYGEWHRAKKQSEASQRWRERHAEELKEKAARIRESGELRGYWREKTARWRKQSRERARQLDAKYYTDLKSKAFEVLGGKCAVCGWTDERALQIDHVEAIGDAERRRKNHRGMKLYRAVLKNPKQFQLLCANHNWIKRVELNEVQRR